MNDGKAKITWNGASISEWLSGESNLRPEFYADATPEALGMPTSTEWSVTLTGEWTPEPQKIRIYIPSSEGEHVYEMDGYEPGNAPAWVDRGQKLTCSVMVDGEPIDVEYIVTNVRELT